MTSRGLAVALVTFATFTDILAYSIAVPVLPHLSHQFGASPTLIGLLFASFGVTVLAVSIPMGAISDRTGRRLPLVGGLIALAGSTVLFAFAPRMTWLFAARLVQGAADAVTWVVGFALVADLYSAQERGRVMGLVMAGSTFGFLIGPTLGGWLYERAGARMPYLVVAGFSIVAAAGFAAIRLPRGIGAREAIPLGTIVRVRAVAVCAACVIVGGGTIAMMEPVLSLFLSSAVSLGPARIGLVFGAGAIVATVLHPIFGRVADRVGGRRLTLRRTRGNRYRDAALRTDFELRIRRGHLCRIRRGDRDVRDAVADLHGRSHIGGRVAVLRRGLRLVQLRVVDRFADRSSARRISLRADRIHGPVLWLGRRRDCRSGDIVPVQ